MKKQKQLIPYSTKQGEQPVIKWLDSLDRQSRNRILAGFAKLEVANFGKCKVINEDIREIKYYFGSGYRVYYGEDGSKIIVLLVGGDKKSQSKDIKKAQEYWNDYLSRKAGAE